ncbi:dCTP deaminase [Nocardioides KLBMP 9356]|uniref:dCTP deaminase n=2 Tax=Nocardioides potassii TaxID=2911371 RepID=A0ABS9HAE7_9ACTN|nr:dCTP deaminase [Nocardioides potassii]
MDVRLGREFITFQRTSTESFSAMRLDQEPREMQVAVEKDWGGAFVLHPGQLVLASTLEYLRLPGDLTAQVITRSSYGRLGLLSATAVQVQPRFVGCLTLELANLGQMPLTLVPGERIAQLVFTRAHPASGPVPSKYELPTGPQFSRVRQDPDLAVLRSMERFRVNPESLHVTGKGLLTSANEVGSPSQLPGGMEGGLITLSLVARPALAVAPSETVVAPWN